MDITKRFQRIVAIYFQLQGKSIVKAQDLADRFDVSLRTIYRDMRSLEQAGIPIYGEAGTGYSLTEGYKLPPTSFTPEEILSLAASEKLMQKFVDPDMFRHFTTAIGKVRSYLRYSEKSSIMVLEENMWMSSPSAMFNENVPDALSILFEAISNRKIVEMEYRAVQRDEANQRLIEPVGVYHEGNFWYFVAYCHLREAHRKFRIDRIEKIKTTTANFSKEHKPLSHYLDKKEISNPVTVRIRIDRAFARYLTWERSYYGFVGDERDGDAVIMTFHSTNLEQEFARWYLRFADQAEILEPPALKNAVRDIVKNFVI